MILLAFCVISLLAWVGVLLMPSQPCRVRERLEAEAPGGDLTAVSVLIPARNEAPVLSRTLAALAQQGVGLEVIVIDDGSDDGTAEAVLAASRRARGAAESGDAATVEPGKVRLLRGAPLPRGWSGKLWALQQGLEEVGRPYTLLLDADIELAPGMLGALLRHATAGDLHLVSIMAKLHCASFWERLLVPPFVFFFKLIYPFAAVNGAARSTAAAAGGCMLLRTSSLRACGAFESIRDALIDDCALAARLKGQGRSIWLGLSHSVNSLRAYPGLADFWRMVARTAFTQLRYSTAFLVLTSLLLFVVFVAPWLALGLVPHRPVAIVAVLAICLMAWAYAPVVGFYGLAPAWGLTLPVAALLYLAMTWASAVGYWRGTRAQWKGRVYEISGGRRC
jgi:hopene-associated glycosyltransferase HpnB